jgi:hypothetical protein
LNANHISAWLSPSRFSPRRSSARRRAAGPWDRETGMSDDLRYKDAVFYELRVRGRTASRGPTGRRACEAASARTGALGGGEPPRGSVDAREHVARERTGLGDEPVEELRLRLASSDEERPVVALHLDQD